MKNGVPKGAPFFTYSPQNEQMKNGVPKGAPFFTYSPQNEQNTPMAINHFNNRQSQGM